MYIQFLPIDELPSYGSLKESGTTVACQDTVMFAGTGVSAHNANQAGSPFLSW